MKLPQFERSWHGIDFSCLPVQLAKRQPAGDSFYSAFYAELSKRMIDPSWRASKEALGDWVERTILRPRQRPEILSIAVGLAIAEEHWLEVGYQVALNECQAASLTDIQSRFPAVKTLIGNVHEIETVQKFDVVTVFTVDYALNDGQLLEMFQRLRHAMTSNGLLVNQTVNVLTIRRILTECIKRWILRRYEQPGWVLWGWSRTPASIVKLAKRAGLKLTNQFIRDGETFRRRASLSWLLPPLRDQDMIMLFERVD